MPVHLCMHDFDVLFLFRFRTYYFNSFLFNKIKFEIHFECHSLIVSNRYLAMWLFCLTRCIVEGVCACQFVRALSHIRVVNKCLQKQIILSCQKCLFVWPLCFQINFFDEYYFP